MDWVTAYIAVGSNVGDRAATIAEALRRLNNDHCRVLRSSTLFENPPIDLPAGSSAFLNGAAELSTRMQPSELLAHLLAVERQLGRVRGNGMTPRTIDLDFLLYRTAILNEAGLIVPHPRMHTRDFVLRPLAEIAGSVMHPAFGRSIDELFRSLK